MAQLQPKQHYMKAVKHKGGQGQKPKNPDELGPHLLTQILNSGAKLASQVVLLNAATGRDHTSIYMPGFNDEDMRMVVSELDQLGEHV